MGTNHTLRIRRGALALGVGLTLLLVQGCAGGVIEEAGSDGIIDPPGSLCRGLTLASPAEGAFIAQSGVLVKGSITTGEPTTLMVDGIDIQAEGGAFEVMLEKADGNHTIEVVCDQSKARRMVLVGSERPHITIDSPTSGALLEETADPITVSGSVSTPQFLRVLQLNGQTIHMDPEGRFTLQYQPIAGMNHLDLVATTLGGEAIDLRRSFIYGRFTDWDDSASALITADIRATALEAVSNILENRLTAEAMQEIFADKIGRQGKLTIRDIRYDALELDFDLQDGRIGVLLRLNNFGISVKYRQNSILKASGWIRCDPVEVGAELVLVATPDGGYDLHLENPQVRLSRFDLDLSGLASLFEGLVEGIVEDIAHDTVLDALQGIVVENLVEANLLEQEIEILGQTTQLNLAVDTLQVNPSGVGIVTHAKLAPFDVVHDAPGFWTSSPDPVGDSGDDHLALGMSIDLFNRILGEAWRGGLMDVDVAGLVGDSNPLSIAILTGVVGPELAERFPATASVQLDSRALMQPIARIVDPRTGHFVVQVGGLQITLSSEDHAGELIHWATLEVSADLAISPRFEQGQFTLDAHLATRIELVDAPLFPIEDEAFEGFLETIINGVAGGSLSGLVDSAFRFGDIDILGIGVGSVNFGSSAADPGFLVLGMNLAARD